MQTPWLKPVVVSIGDPPVETTVTTTQGASWALIEDWPVDEGPALTRALAMCVGVLERKNKPEEARQAFLEAAKEAEVLVSA